MNTDTQLTPMLEALASNDSSINVQNLTSDYGRLFHMAVPFQVTLEYSNGLNLNDYVNIVTLSPQHSIMYQETLSTKNFVDSKDAPHYHDFYEFVIVLEGTIVQIIEGKEYIYPPQNLLSY